MIFWKSWFDLRGRFFLCVALITIALCPQSIFIAVHEARGTVPTFIQEAGVTSDEDEEASFTLDEYVRRWFRGSEFAVPLLTIVLAVGGTMTESHTRSNLFTLSLPIRRRRWLTGHWLMAAGMSLALILYSALIFLAVGWGVGVSVPNNVILTGIFTLTFWVSIWIGPSMASTAITREPVKAALLVIGLLIGVMLVGDTQILGPWHIGDLRLWETWRAGFPWQALLAATTLGLGGFVWAVARFERADY